MARGGGGVVSWAWPGITADNSSAAEQSLPKGLVEIIALE
jgi:hypothetical protein